MTSKDKLIGLALILFGIAFIALGVMTGMSTSKVNNQVYNENQVYTEQNMNAETENNVVEDATNGGMEVNVYTEETQVPSENSTNGTTNEEEGSTRYIY